MKSLRKTECACERCKAACRHVPGWFRPGEAEKAAKLLKMPLRKFFKKYLGVNYYDDDKFVLAPATTRMKPGTEYPPDPRGVCVFLTNKGKCRIHSAKPWVYSHGNPCSIDHNAAQKAQQRTAMLWQTKKHQKQIETLLGRKPNPEPPSWGDLMRMMWGI